MPTVAELKDRFAIAADEFTFEVRGETLRARAAADASELMRLEKRVRRLIEVCRDRPAPGWEPFLPASDDVVRMAVYLEALMVDPPIAFHEALELGKSCGFLLVEMSNALLERSGVVTAAATEQEIDDAKNA